jgi:hypothetical protein
LVSEENATVLERFTREVMAETLRFTMRVAQEHQALSFEGDLLEGSLEKLSRQLARALMDCVTVDARRVGAELRLCPSAGICARGQKRIVAY